MRLESLRLLRYGPFEDLALSLDPRPGFLNLVCAPNGAGKSVLRQAFSDLLFGIGGQTQMGFRHGYQGMRLAAAAVTPDGTRHSFGRRKGHGNTWTDGDGAPLANPSIGTYLLRTDPRTLERLFALDTARLRDGGQALLEEEGHIADALLNARGIGGARKLRESLNEFADDLAPQRKSANRPYYLALETYLAARRAASDALLRPEAWERLERARDETAARLAAHRDSAAAAAVDAARLERIRRTRQPLAVLDEASAWLAANPAAPALPADLGMRLDDARHRLNAARQQEQREAERRQALLADLQSVTVDGALLAEAADIERLAEQTGAEEKALADMPGLRARLTDIRDRIETHLRRLGSAVPAAQAATLIPQRAVETRARTLIAQHEARAAARADAETNLATVGRELAGRRDAETALPAEADTAELAALRDAVLRAGDPAVQEEAARAALAQSEAALAAALAAIPGWQGSAEALAMLALHPAPTYERAHAALTEAETSLHRAEDTCTAARMRYDGATTSLEALRAGGEIPDRAAVDAARRQRDELYALIARMAFGGAAPSHNELNAAGGLPLALAHDQAVARSDRLADRRAEESQLVAQAAELTRLQAEAARSLADLKAGLAAAKARAAAAEAAWRTLLPPKLPAVARLEDVRAFLAARARVLERQETRATAQAALDRLVEHHAGWTAAFATALGRASASLPVLLQEAAAQLQQANRAQLQRAELRAELGSLQRRAAALQAARQKAQDAYDVWQREWAETLVALGRPADEPVEVTSDIIQLLADLAADLERATETERRLNDIRQDSEQFAAHVAALAVRLNLAPPATVPGRAMLATVRTLRDRLAEQRRRDERRNNLTGQIEQAGATLAALTQARASRETDLAAVLDACGAATETEAEQRLAQSAARAAAVAALAEAQQALLGDGEGYPIEQLWADSDAVPPDTLIAALEQARADARDAHNAAQDAAAELALLNADLDRRGRDTAYADARDAQAGAVASADRILREALAARLAAMLLGQAMEAVEREGSADMLARIGTWFRAITGGAYRGLGTEPDADGRQKLIAIPADRPDEIKHVEQLSEGTRDQLYLALRLEAVAAHADALPFIADDILQTFDDARAEAALRALLTLSDRVQVIVLTHHRHILDLAQKAAPDRVHVCGLC